jgi:hypothetical protein
MLTGYKQRCGLGVAGLILWAHNRAYLPVSAVVSVVAFPTLGALIAARRPENRIGWMFCAIGVLYGLWLFTSQYAIYALLTEPGSVPGAAAAAWLSSWIWAPPIWLTGTICILLFPMAAASPRAAGDRSPWLAGAVNLSLFPFAVAIAILRHHMYDIDLVIRRTLVYGLVSGILGLGYAGTVLILGQLFGGVSRDTPSWAIAASTLTVAALFQPVRRRIQRAVDRRFNRRRHDASQTIATFADRLHQQLDLDALSAELLQVVGQTMEPTTASLWLRQPQDGTRSPDR